MIHLTHIESNIAGGVDADLGAKTLILGPSAGGKTTMVRAIELAVAGGTSDLEGRGWVGDDPRLLALAPEGSDEVWSKATLSDDTETAFQKTAGKRASLPRGVGKVLALQQVREALTGSADNARLFVMDVACGAVTKADVLSRLPAGLHESYEALHSVVNGRKPVDKLQGVQKLAAQRARDLKKEAKGAKDTIEALAEPGGAPTEAQLEAATAKARELQQYAFLAQRAGAQREQREQTVAQINQHEIAIEHWTIQLAGIPEAGPDDIAMQQKWARAQAIKQVIEGQRKTPSTCQICAATHEAPTLKARLDQLDTAIDTALNQFGARQEALELRDKILAKLAELNASHGRLQNQLASMSSEVYNGDVAALQAEADAAEKHRQELLAAFDTSKKLARARALSHEGMEKADRFKRLSDACKEAISELVKSNLKTFVQRVNKYMPSRMVFGVESGTRFRVGLVNGQGSMRTALSGAEWVAVTTAIGCAVTEKAECAVLLPEERAYDPDMLARIMRGLTKAPAQVILTSTVKFKGRQPSGWTVIDLGD